MGFQSDGNDDRACGFALLDPANRLCLTRLVVGCQVGLRDMQCLRPEQVWGLDSFPSTSTPLSSHNVSCRGGK